MSLPHRTSQIPPARRMNTMVRMMDRMILRFLDIFFLAFCGFWDFASFLDFLGDVSGDELGDSGGVDGVT